MPTREEEYRQHRAQVAKQQEQRRAELDYFAKITADRAAEQGRLEKARAATYQRIVAYREAVARGEIDPTVTRARLPTLESIYTAKREADIAQAAQAEQRRQASIAPHDIWLSTLSFGERERISRWEQINRMPWPYVPGDKA